MKEKSTKVETSWAAILQIALYGQKTLEDYRQEGWKTFKDIQDETGLSKNKLYTLLNLAITEKRITSKRTSYYSNETQSKHNITLYKIL